MSCTEKLQALDWEALQRDLDHRGYGLTPPLLSAAECAGLASLYDHPDNFRTTVVMARHGFGSGEYKYFRYPLPPLVQALRTLLYEQLAPLANHWAQALRLQQHWPDNHAELLELCRRQGQTRPTPLLLDYSTGDYNCLHRDLYGDLHFPLQAVILLSRPGEDFDGGLFTLVENRPRRQSRCEVPPLGFGQILVFPVRDRPRPSVRGYARASMRHGVTTISRGHRRTLGIIFHDAL
ncbi:proline hydroxylase [Exilibacterium tricleocarpae]|uniref:Proline hydroxylase n=1 Tax=Exilibacterium tricleocarpae TaxID=2591008 RepID=A0A545SS60_9GAMM|nr:2OG-Fe(II) oxygenase [Exilibacterium tricleocarpae]TQV67792.1 proline hydroxylase [Exilibacterium tricleocarpae]